MNLSQFMWGLAVVLGVVVMVGGFRTRHRGGSAPLLFGAALVVGPASLLLKGHVSEPALVVSTFVSAALSVAGAVLVWVRTRRAR